MSERLFHCSKCQKDLPRSAFHECNFRDSYKPVTAQCRKCRKESRYVNLYTTVCICCNKPRKLDLNQQCSKCNAEKGLKQCNVCGQLKTLYLEFYGRSKKCRDCFKLNVNQKKLTEEHPLQEDEPLL